MSFTSAGLPGSEDPIRRQYCFRNITAQAATLGSDYTYYVKDQLPNNILVRVSANAMWSPDTIFNSLGSSRICELRLYNAFSTDRVYIDANDGDYVVLGYFYVSSPGNAGTSPANWEFAPNYPIQTKTLHGQPWRFVIYSINDGKAWDKSTTADLLAITIDVRAGGDDKWHD